MNKKKIIRIIFLLLFLILMILSLKNIIIWYKENEKVKDIVKEEKKLLDTEEKYLDESIKKDNEYTIGWIKVAKTNIDYPVVQYINNDYYLNHDFKNNRNSTGWVFMDYQNKLDDQNIVVYAHHRRDGSMFGSIDKLFNEKEDSNIEITLITTKEIIKYEVFSIYKISSKDNYNSRNFENFNETLEKLASRSNIKFNNNYINTKQIITLSTCDNNNVDRIVVHGYKR